MTDKYQKLTQIEHVLHRSGMYMGSIATDKITDYIYNEDTKLFEKRLLNYNSGLLKIFDEIVSNAVDHYYRIAQEKGKHPVKNIKVDINKETGDISVYNDGEGIPVRVHDKHNIYIPEMLFSHFNTSSNYDDTKERNTTGTNGIGSKLTVVFSKSFTVETVNSEDGKKFVQTYSNNLSEKSKVKITSFSKAPYTRIVFTPDYARFGMPNLNDDMFEVMKKRVIDICAVTGTNLSVYFNTVKIPITNFEKYVDLYIGSKSDAKRIYEGSTDGKWEVVCCDSPTNNFEQVSFVNSAPTLKGGKHVDYITNQILKGLDEMLKKKKITIKPILLKNNMMVFVKALIDKPSYTSQSKEELTTIISKFGSKFDVSDKFVQKVYKETSIIDLSVQQNVAVIEKQIAKTDGKKQSRVVINNFNDAPLAGTKKSNECYLFICEGLSAKTMVISGLSVIGTDRYGCAPLKGKLINVKDTTLATLSKNNEISNLKKMLGLESGKKYEDTSSLRYNGIVILTDADLDGYHIRGLICNMFQTLWPSLFKMKGFITTMMTPIIKARKGSEKKYFYTMQEYHEWDRTNNTRGWNITYLKGAGSSTAEEAKEFFKNMKKITYNYTDTSDSAMDLAFNKKRADDRKEWLINYDKDRILEIPNNMEVNYEEYIHKELIHFSQRDIDRNIPNLCDNLKESFRKILYTCFKKGYKDVNHEIKVSQLASITSSYTNYLHGEVSLAGAIVGMAQNFVGSNNINILAQSGQFGTRLANGKDAAQSRYIFTYLTEICKKIFRVEDLPILTYKEEEGQVVEPEYFIPVIPMTFITETIGIGTGYSTNIPNYNPQEVIDQCRLMCKNLEECETDTSSPGTFEEKYIKKINDTQFSNLYPYYLGFKGEITKSDKTDNIYKSTGVYTVDSVNSDIITITEIPISVSIENYKSHLEELLQEGMIKDFQSHYTALNVKFIVHLLPNFNKTKLDNILKLSSTSNLSCNNMHLLSETGAIRKYNNIPDIFKEWSSIRIKKYQERKDHQLKALKKDYKTLYWKAKFINDVITNTIKIMNVPNTEVISKLESMEYPKLGSPTPTTDTPSPSPPTTDTPSTTNYNYLLKMSINTLTKENKEKLEKDADELYKQIEVLKKTKISKIWSTELDEVEEEYIKYKKEFDEMYENDHNNVNQSKNSSRTTSKKKK